MKNYEVILRPNRSWLRIDWRSIVEFRDLLFMLVWRDFAVKHKQTVLGPAWLVINPLMTTMIFTVVFGGIARIPTDGLPPTLFYLCGLLGWNFFARTLQQTASTFVSNAHIFEKVYFPRLILPLAAAASNVISFGIEFAMFAGFWLYFRFLTDAGADLGLNMNMLLLPLLVLHAGTLAVGVGIWIAALTVKYRDLLVVISLAVQLWMYATPVIYPISQAPQRYFWIVALNPMGQVIESFRYLLLGKGTVDPMLYGLSIGVTLLVLLSGIMIFQRTERTFIDTV